MPSITSWSNCHQVSNLYLYGMFRKVWSKLKVENRHFQQSSGRNSKINDLMGTVFKFIQDFIHAHLICKFQDDQNWMSYADESNIVKYRLFQQWVKHRLFQQSRGYYSKTNDSIWPGFELVWDSILVHLICIFQEDPIKTEWIMLMTVKQRLFQQWGGCNSQINDPIWPVFEFIRDWWNIFFSW